MRQLLLSHSSLPFSIFSVCLCIPVSASQVMCVRWFDCYDCYSIRWILHHASQPGSDIISSSLCAYSRMLAQIHTHLLVWLIFLCSFCHVVAFFPPNHLQFWAINLWQSAKLASMMIFSLLFFPRSSSYFVVDVLLLWNSQRVRVFIADANAF